MPTYTEKHGMLFSEETEGAVSYDDCKTRKRRQCQCGICAVCGERKHTVIHGPSFGEKSGSKPWGHKFVPEAGDRRSRATSPSSKRRGA